jgi:hypothetical protein
VQDPAVERREDLGRRAGLAQVAAAVAHDVLEHAAADAMGDGPEVLGDRDGMGWAWAGSFL